MIGRIRRACSMLKTIGGAGRPAPSAAPAAAGVGGDGYRAAPANAQRPRITWSFGLRAQSPHRVDPARLPRAQHERISFGEHRDFYYVHQRQGPKTLDAILTFLDTRTMDPEREVFDFTVSGPLTSHHLQRLQAYPFEVLIVRLDDTVYLTTGGRGDCAIPPARHAHKGEESFHLHTHPGHPDGTASDAPSTADLYQVQNNRPDTVYFVAHGNGLLQYRGVRTHPLSGQPVPNERWDDPQLGRSLISAYCAHAGVAPGDAPRDEANLIPVETMSRREWARVLRTAMGASGCIRAEWAWADAAAIDQCLQRALDPATPLPTAAAVPTEPFPVLELPPTEGIADVRPTHLAWRLCGYAPDVFASWMEEVGPCLLPTEHDDVTLGFAILRWRRVGGAQARTEALDRKLVEVLDRMTAQHMQIDPIDWLRDALDTASPQLSHCLEILREPSIHRHIGMHYGVALDPAWPQSLDDIFAVHPTTRPKAIVLSEEAVKLLTFARAAGLSVDASIKGWAAPIETIKAPYRSSWSRMRIHRAELDSMYRFFRTLAHQWRATALQQQSEAGSGTEISLKSKLQEQYGHDPVALWRALGLEREYRASDLPKGSAFWQSTLPLAQIYQQLQRATAQRSS